MTKWFGGGAAHHNFYMYCGGNILGIHQANGVTNGYSNGPNYHSDGLPYEPKRTHLSRLVKMIADNQESH